MKINPIPDSSEPRAAYWARVSKNCRLPHLLMRQAAGREDPGALDMIPIQVGDRKRMYFFPDGSSAVAGHGSDITVHAGRRAR